MSGDPALSGPCPVLLLAGTTEAAALARALGDDPLFDVEVSFAGRVASPSALPGRVRVGGFGGVDGLGAHLRHERHQRLVDATHPFAATMTAHAADAARRLGIPHVRLLRPPWRPQPGDGWLEVDDLPAAAATITELGARRPFLALGRHHLGAFAALGPGIVAVVRSIDPLEEASGLPLTNVVARGPFGVDDELELLRSHEVDVVVARNSGGDATSAKLEAARRLGLPVVLVRRPPLPPGIAVVPTVADALDWLRAPPV